MQATTAIVIAEARHKIMALRLVIASNAKITGFIRCIFWLEGVLSGLFRYLVRQIFFILALWTSASSGVSCSATIF